MIKADRDTSEYGKRQRDTDRLTGLCSCSVILIGQGLLSLSPSGSIIKGTKGQQFNKLRDIKENF